MGDQQQEQQGGYEDQGKQDQNTTPAEPTEVSPGEQQEPQEPEQPAE